MKFTACVFARGGSKGLPNKNIKIFNGKPLIAWSICQAKKIKDIKKIIVSTDSEEIAKIARDYGADVPFVRPKHLAEDDSAEWDSWKHLINYLIKIDDLPDALISVPSSSPLRSPEDIQLCIDKFRLGKFDSIVTATKSKRSPYFNMIKINENGFCEILEKNTKNKFFNRQSVPKSYDLTTVCYVVSSKFIINNNGLFEGKVGFVEIPEERSIDIDNEWDFKLADLIYLNSINEK